MLYRVQGKGKYEGEVEAEVEAEVAVERDGLEWMDG